MKERKWTAKRIEPIMRYFFIILTIGAIIFNYLNAQWEIFLSAILTLMIFLLPTILAKRAKISIPAPMQIIILLFIFASMYLGEVQQYFRRYTWWDSMLHTVSAFLLGYIGFLLIYTLNKDRNIHIKLSPFFIALFTFCFAMTVGVIWEIFEFLVDGIFGADMQKSRNLEEVYGYFCTRLGVLDTMRDFIVNTAGALIVSIIGYYYSKKRMVKDNAFWKLKDQFIEENPDLFNKTYKKQDSKEKKSTRP
jgi:VanZ family protein